MDLPRLLPARFPDPENGLPGLADLGPEWGSLVLAGVLADLSRDAVGPGGGRELLAGELPDGRAVHALVWLDGLRDVRVELATGSGASGWSPVPGGGVLADAAGGFASRRRDPAGRFVRQALLAWELAVRARP